MYTQKNRGNFLTFSGTGISISSFVVHSFQSPAPPFPASIPFGDIGATVLELVAQYLSERHGQRIPRTRIERSSSAGRTAVGIKVRVMVSVRGSSEPLPPQSLPPLGPQRVPLRALLGNRIFSNNGFYGACLSLLCMSIPRPTSPRWRSGFYVGLVGSLDPFEFR